MTKVSIITVILNNRSNVNNVLDTVQLQTYRAVEHVVIDGGSTDGTLDILKKH